MYDVPAGWKERVISKVEKGTNGTDSEWYNPANKREKVYTTYLGGFRKLGPKVRFDSQDICKNLNQALKTTPMKVSQKVFLPEDVTASRHLYHILRSKAI